MVILLGNRKGLEILLPSSKIFLGDCNWKCSRTRMFNANVIHVLEPESTRH